MDFDAMGVDDYAGCLFLNLGECPIERDQDDIPLPPEPKWTEFFLEKHGDSTGELLVSYQVETRSPLRRCVRCTGLPWHDGQRGRQRLRPPPPMFV